MRTSKWMLISGLAVTTIACVPARKFEEVQSKHKKCAEENESLKTSKKALEEDNTELMEANRRLDKSNFILAKDTALLGGSLRRKEKQYDKINRLNDEIQRKLEALQRGTAQEASSLSSKLLITQEDLQRERDALRILERELEEKKRSLADRERRIKELEDILAKKDAAVRAIKEKLQKALLGFEKQGLSIEQKNGKVYVSLEERLLFQSGSYTVGNNGVKVLKELAKVLEENKDINVLVEGHTDNVPYRSSGALKDNWDLSVKRATSVVKIITTNSRTEPSRLTAAGRGEYLPLESGNSAEARKKNRRIEVILTPKLDELFQILESN